MSGALARARSAKRLRLLYVGYLIVSLAIGWRLVSIQVVEAETYRDLAARQSQRELELVPDRGRLMDRSGQPLALSLAAATIYANPRVIAEGDEGIDEVAAQLAPLLDRGVDELTELLSRDASFVYLGRQLPRAVGEQVAALDLLGVGLLREPVRTYPGGELGSEVIGFAGVDHTGLSGLELAHDALLTGEVGRMSLERGLGGLVINAAPTELEPATPGTDLVLTLDRKVQWATEEALRGAVSRYNAIGGSAVVIDVPTGGVLAMANVAADDASDRGAEDGYAQRNRAVTDAFEPGSVNKVITAAAALEAGVVTPSTPMHVPDRITTGGNEFSDSEPHPPWDIDFSGVIRRSSNVGTIQVANELGRERMHKALRDFGYGERTGVGFPGETSGMLHDVDDWSATSLPTMAIGQGVSASLLQVASVLATIANDGERIPPHLVQGHLDEDGQLVPDAAHEPVRVVTPEIAQAVGTMLRDAVTDGTGSLAAVPGFDVAGKTGTAQKPSRTARGYVEGAYLATFAGFAPVDNPRIAVAIVLDEPTPFYGGQSAAPTFAEITGPVLSVLRVPPTDPAARAQGRPAEAEEADVELELEADVPGTP